MINGVNTSTNNVTDWSRVQSTQQADRQSQILEQAFDAPKATRPNEDVFSSARTRNNEARAELYEGINRDLASARESGTQAMNFGNALVDGLSELRDLATRYEQASGDSATRSSIAADFEERARTLGEFIAENQPQNTVSAALRSGSSSNLTLNVTESRFDFSQIGNMRLEDFDATSESRSSFMENLDKELTNAARLTATAERFNTIADRQMRINENLYIPRAQQTPEEETPPTTDDTEETQQANASSQTQTNEVPAPSAPSIEEMKEFVNGINSAIIQQSIDAMNTQANMSPENVSRLFQ